MVKTTEFNTLVTKAVEQIGHLQLRPVIKKELLHYDILFLLDRENLLENLIFQGGTSLRLCYGSNRFSEDLDFVGGTRFVSADLMAIKECIEHYIGERYGLDVTVKEPKEMINEPNYRDIKVDKWQISVITSPEKKDIPKQRIKLEVANVPAYSKEPRVLMANYDFLPDGYSDTLIYVESLEEIMADKLISLVNTQRYVRYRDIWDLRWLKQKNVTISSDYLLKKIHDYHITDYAEKLNDMRANIKDYINGQDFLTEMKRFLPEADLARTLYKEGFKEYLYNEINELLSQVQSIIKNW